MASRVKITPEIREKLDKYLAVRGHTQDSLGKLTNVSGAAVGQWMSGETKSFSRQTWSRLKEVIPSIDDPAHLDEDAVLPKCPLSDCPARGIEHEPLTAELLADWSAMNRWEKLEALQAIDEIRSKQRAAAGI